MWERLERSRVGGGTKKKGMYEGLKAAVDGGEHKGKRVNMWAEENIEARMTREKRCDEKGTLTCVSCFFHLRGSVCSAIVLIIKTCIMCHVQGPMTSVGITFFSFSKFCVE